MLDIAREYTAQADGDRQFAAVRLARGLMQGDPATFKAGYTADDAAIATAEAFELTNEEIGTLVSSLGGNEDIVRRCVERGRAEKGA